MENGETVFPTTKLYLLKRAKELFLLVLWNCHYVTRVCVVY